MKVKGLSWVLFLLVLGSLGCRSAMYSTYEKFGVHKRDLLKKRVVAARDEQKEAGQEFQDALTRLRSMYNVQGGELEKQYDKLKSDFDSANAKAEAVRKRIRDVETVANDLFVEWEKEIGQISAESMRATSRRQLSDTRSRYQDLHSALKRAENSMEPVLGRFRDQVLFLKHNLNAQAIASLKGEATSIQGDITRLIEEMNRSIAEADKFVQNMQ